MSLWTVALCTHVMGIAVGYWIFALLHRARRKILSNWEPGMKITTSDGETLYVCAVDPAPAGGTEP